MNDPLVNLWNDVRPDSFTISVPCCSIFSLISLVKLMASDKQHQGCHEGQIVGNQICEACWQYPAPLDEDLSQIVWMSDQSVPARNYQLLVASGRQGLKMSQSGVVGVLGKLTSLGLT